MFPMLPMFSQKESTRGKSCRVGRCVFRLFSDEQTDFPQLPFFGGYKANISELSFNINDLGGYNRWLQKAKIGNKRLCYQLFL